MERLKELREERGLTQVQLAEQIGCGLSGKRVSHYEKGRSFPDKDLLIAFAVFFNTSTDYLLGVSDVRTKFFTNPKQEKLLNIMSMLPESSQDEIVHQAEYQLMRKLHQSNP